MRKMNWNYMLPPILSAHFVILCCQGCGQEQEKADRLAAQGAADGPSAPTRTVEPFAHERRAALWTDAWGGMRVDWTAVADWPTGDSPAAKAARRWIDKQLRYDRKSFDGDLRDWDTMTRFHGVRFLADNGQKQIEVEWRGPNGEETKPRTGMPDVDPGADVFLEESPRWFSRHSATIEYEDERIVSYRSGFYGCHVGNATSAAFIHCATFRKSDGKILGWNAFADTNKVFQAIREQAKEKFGKNADIYGRGIIPVPDKPLFTKDGFRVYWGDYAIDTPHTYEEDGKFPTLFIPWHYLHVKPSAFDEL